MFFVHIETELCTCVLLVKEECASEEEEEEEDEAVKDALVEEILQQGDTAIIYPEAPEDEQSPTEAGGADENGNSVHAGQYGISSASCSPEHS